MYLESLEDRRLRSVTVVQGYPGFYEVYGDDSDNVITIDVNAADRTFSIDGKTFAGLNQLAVYGLGGNDLILVSSTPGSTISASIDGGAGDDILSLNFDGAIRGGEGNDRLYLYDSFRGEVYGGGGDDYIWISGNCVDAAVNGDDGDDWIDASSNFYRVFIHGGAGNDVIFGSNFDDYIFGDGGNDADDSGPWALLTPTDPTAQRITVGPESPGQLFVDDGNGVWCKMIIRTHV